MNDELYKKTRNINLIVFDVDGVLTDGSLILGESGNEYKIFNVKDGHGLVMLLNSGVSIAVITSRDSKIVSERMASLGIKYVYQGKQDKRQAMQELLEKLSLEKDQVAYVGDDLIDIPAMACAGLKIAVADAHPVVIQQADWTTDAPGGQGAVREICERVMKAQGTLDQQINLYLEQGQN